MSRLQHRNFTHLELKNAKDGDHNIGNGLFLKVENNGKRKSWKWRFTSPVTKKRRVKGLGSAFHLSIAEARRKAIVFSQLVQQGIDPIEERKREKEEEQYKKASSISFQILAEQYINLHKHEKEKRWERTYLSRLKNYVYPILKNKLITQITREDAIRIINNVIKATSDDGGRRVRTFCETIINYAKGENIFKGENPFTLEVIKHSLIKSDKKKEHFPSIPFREFPKFIKGLTDSKTPSNLALKFLILTVTRSSETRYANWSEVDMENKLWSISAERMKMKKDHIIPLSDKAINILKIAKKYYGNKGLIFPNNKGDALSDVALSKILKKICNNLGIIDEHTKKIPTVHGVRSSFRNWVEGKNKFTRQAKELALAHANKNHVEGAYLRDSLLDQRIPMMQLWSDYCYSIRNI